MHSPINIKCLCGLVTLQLTHLPKRFSVCHCSSCQTWNGGPTMMAPCGENVVVLGKEHVKEFRSSEWARRAFCKECGSHMYSRFVNTGTFNIPAGHFASFAQMTMETQYFIDRKPGYYSFEDESETLTSEEVFALFTQSS
ncbi:GFA family protein [Vibrio nigripulchritudo]|uniref:GFA family protein n=1 Tax=Vibrio nigripulchritudo TaxID=28173 RepID=UPI00056DEEE8|nr:GFA family protein [Vibrio nigripulchritudo]